MVPRPHRSPHFPSPIPTRTLNLLHLQRARHVVALLHVCVLDLVARLLARRSSHPWSAEPFSSPVLSSASPFSAPVLSSASPFSAPVLSSFQIGRPMCGRRAHVRGVQRVDLCSTQAEVRLSTARRRIALRDGVRVPNCVHVKATMAQASAPAYTPSVAVQRRASPAYRRRGNTLATECYLFATPPPPHARCSTGLCQRISDISRGPEVTLPDVAIYPRNTAGGARAGAGSFSRTTTTEPV